MEPNKKRNIKIVLIVSAIIIIVALVTTGIIYFLKDKNVGPDPVTPPVENNTNTEVVNPPEEGRNLQNDTKALHSAYPDCTAWIKVPGTNIDGPIFQSKDNDRYLRHDRDNKKTKWGEYFLDYRSKADNLESMSHLIVYGHNTDTDDHFTPLLKYKNKDFFQANPIIEVSTLGGNYKWQIFSAYVTDTNSFYYIETDFADKEAYGSFVSTIKSQSAYDTGVSVSADDTVITLSTCDYSRTDGRYVVHAKLIK